MLSSCDVPPPFARGPQRWLAANRVSSGDSPDLARQREPKTPAALPFVLALAVLGISISGPLARLAAAPPLAIAVWRLLLSLVAIAIVLIANGAWREWRTLSRRDLAIAAAAGAMLALHFWSWIASLGMTSVAASVLLVNLHPIVIVAGSALWLGERPSRAQVIGLFIALLGAAIVGLGDGDVSTSPQLGNLLAILGAVTVGLYYLAGRTLRQRLSLWAYVGLVYGACLVVLLLLAVWQRTPLWPYAPRELGIFALIAIGPMLAGHTGFNWSLKYVPAYVISFALLLEPVGAALIAWLWMHETPSMATLGGGVVVMIGLGASIGPTRGARSE
jgi:drug/metabolite transporter (DMT)-like permease